MKTAVLIDSASDLTLGQSIQLGLSLFNLDVEFNGKVWRNTNEIPDDYMYSLLMAGVPHPAYANINKDYYSNYLESMLNKSDHVIAIHSSMGGNTLHVARRAAQHFPGRVTVCEAFANSGPMALLGSKAVQYFATGLTPIQVLEKIRLAREQSRMAIHIETSQFMPQVGELGEEIKKYPADSKLIIRTLEQEHKILSSTLSSEMALKMMRQRLQRKAKDLAGGEIVFSHNNAPEKIEFLSEAAVAYGLKATFTVDIGPVAASYLGPGAYGFAIWPSGL